MLAPRSWKKNYDTPRQHIKKQRHYFFNKSLSSQSFDFSSSHVWMWELDHKEDHTLKNWCFYTVVSRRLLKVSWTARRSSQSILKKINPEYLLEGLKLQYFGHLMQIADSLEKTLMLGQIEGRRRSGWQRMRWLDVITDNGHEFEQAPGDGEGQGSLACCSPWGHKELNMTEQLKNNKKPPGLWRTNFCCFTSLSMWSFVTIILGTQHRQHFSFDSSRSQLWRQGWSTSRFRGRIPGSTSGGVGKGGKDGKTASTGHGVSLRWEVHGVQARHLQQASCLHFLRKEAGGL